MTYSIAARDPATGELGVGVQTHQPCVGAIVPWVKAGAGAIATQSFANMAFGPQGLALLENGLNAAGALTALLAADEMPGVRQVAVLAPDGPPAVHTGEKCIPYAGHHVGEHYSVQANMMLHDTVPAAMAAAFEGADGPLAIRILRVLEAAQSEGGDIRGSQSAAILVRASGPVSSTWDLRIDNDPAPLARLRVLVNARMAGLRIGANDGTGVDAMLAGYEAAHALHPWDEQTFWFAVSGLSAAAGEAERAAALLAPLFERAPQWLELLHRLEVPGAAALKGHFARSS